MNPVIPHQRRYPNLLSNGRPHANHGQGHRPEYGELHSSLALEQLTRLAQRCLEPEFVMCLAPVFGLDIPAQSYLDLQTALLQGRISPPRCRIVHSGFYPAEYDNDSRTLLIHTAALEHVDNDPQSAWELLEILLHEFGHYLDTLLRQDLTHTGPAHHDAPAEEGSAFALRMAAVGWGGSQKALLASYVNLQGQLVNLSIEPQAALSHILSQRRSATPGHDRLTEPRRERFEATGEEAGKFSHERIEKSLLGLGFSEFERQSIHFGNWLRDYSQLLDPKLVRGPEMPKAFPKLLSRQALTEVVDILAARHFAEARLQDPGSFRVTPERLGVYRPSEHIDNPRVEPPAPFDLAERDADFEPWVLAGDPLLELDFETSMKAYIHRSRAFMQDELRAAMQLGRTPEGLRHFGSALHVLEDFFAHSNFVELGLIKLGHDVLPWTSPATCRHGLPLVTGSFAGADIIASLAQPIAQLIAPAENWQFLPKQPGELSDTDRMLLVLLNEHENQSLLKAYEGWLDFRDVLRDDKLVMALKFKTWLLEAPGRLLTNALNEVQRGILTLIGSHVDDLQTVLGGDPNHNGSTDPSHSQLAKDHAEHPLHEPAGLMAVQAVTTLAQTMLAYWNGDSDEDPLQVAAFFFSHANDSEWQDDLLATWAISNPDQVERAGSLSDLQSLQEQLHTQARQVLSTFAQEKLATWDYLKKLVTDVMG